MSDRYKTLPDHGTLYVSTDLHGNLADYQQLAARIVPEMARDDTVHWAILGDLVHGPNEEAGERFPHLYEYEDQSETILEMITPLQRLFPDNIHILLGNHEYAHMGGPRVDKFYDDEAAHLEQRMSERQRDVLGDILESSLLALASPCGIFASHGAPGLELDGLNELDAVELPPADGDARSREIMGQFVGSYGQPGEIARAFLDSVSEPGLNLELIVHGHDRDEEGWFTEGGNQICPVLFGAPDHKKRFLRFDLGARYESLDDIREGQELLHVHGDARPSRAYGLRPSVELLHLDEQRRGRRLLVESKCHLGRMGGPAAVGFDDGALGRRHAQLQVDGDGAVLHDHNTTNGTYVNVSRVFEHQLRRGDVIYLGDTILMVREIITGSSE